MNTLNVSNNSWAITPSNCMSLACWMLWGNISENSWSWTRQNLRSEILHIWRMFWFDSKSCIPVYFTENLDHPLATWMKVYSGRDGFCAVGAAVHGHYWCLISVNVFHFCCLQQDRTYLPTVSFIHPIFRHHSPNPHYTVSPSHSVFSYDPFLLFNFTINLLSLILKLLFSSSSLSMLFCSLQNLPQSFHVRHFSSYLQLLKVYSRACIRSFFSQEVVKQQRHLVAPILQEPQLIWQHITRQMECVGSHTSFAVLKGSTLGLQV